MLTEMASSSVYVKAVLCSTAAFPKPVSFTSAELQTICLAFGKDRDVVSFLREVHFILA